jgi:hypothetical protein
LFRRSDEWDTVFKAFPELATVCIERAQTEGDQEIIPQIERMVRAHEPLGEDEIAWL